MKANKSHLTDHVWSRFKVTNNAMFIIKENHYLFFQYELFLVIMLSSLVLFFHTKLVWLITLCGLMLHPSQLNKNYFIVAHSLNPPQNFYIISETQFFKRNIFYACLKKPVFCLKKNFLYLHEKPNLSTLTLNREK